MVSSMQISPNESMGWIEFRGGVIARSKSGSGIRLIPEDLSRFSDVLRKTAQAIEQGVLEDESGKSISLNDPDVTFENKLRAISIFMSEVSRGQATIAFIDSSEHSHLDVPAG